MLNNLQAQIDALFKRSDFDIRKTHNGRFIDQKCTPDILSSVAEAIIVFTEVNSSSNFTIRDIWESPFAEKVMTELFQKPSVKDEGAANEYDKVFSQPIVLLKSAGIISPINNRRPVKYQIDEPDILTYIALSDKKALDFLIQYLNKVMNDSGLMGLFSHFFEVPNRNTFNQLKVGFTNFLIQNTNINGEVECRRIFTKVLNPLAFSLGALGTYKGRISPAPISYQELFYNRINFRDVAKPKGVSRGDWVKSLSETTGSSEKFQVDKAKRSVKRYENCRNEVNRYSHEHADHVHHIFPMCDYPELSDTFENLIVLNPTQHLSYAHPRGNTNEVSKSYQLVCILAKLNSILSSLDAQDGFYSLEQFMVMINTGLGHNILKQGMSPELMQKHIAEEYCS